MSILRSIQYQTCTLLGPARVYPSVAGGRQLFYSTLNERHEALVEGRVPPITYEEVKNKAALAKRFGQFGLASGVDIRRLWPTVEEVKQWKELRLHRSANEARQIALKVDADKRARVEKRSMDMIQHSSLVQYLGISSRKSSRYCGYCKPTNVQDEEEAGSEEDSEDSSSAASSAVKHSVCFGVGAIRLFTAHVNQLLDAGWNWSGRYLYKPIMDRTCCPLYAIRLNVHNLKLSRSQKRVLNVWKEFLQADKRPPLRGNVQNFVSAEKRQAQKLRSKQSSEPTQPQKSRTKDRSMKLKEQRKQRAFERLRSKGISIEEYQKARQAKEAARKRTLESLLGTWDESWAHKLEIRTVGVETAEFEQTEDESYAVYQKYQNHVHNDTRASRRGYKSFLVDTPFKPSDRAADMLPHQGTYHQHYKVDGRIIAVGVIDILPHCLSSAYFYYDPDYAFLNLGTYSALREIAYVRQLAVFRPQCHYYYLGYYVHDCRKMRYKGAFQPSELLCDRTHHWVPLTECVEKIERNDGRFTVFRPDEPTAPVGNVFQSKPLRFHSDEAAFERLSVSNELATQLEPYAAFFGPLCESIYVVV